MVGQYNQPAVWFSLVLTYFDLLRAYNTWTETDQPYQLLTINLQQTDTNDN